MGAEVMLMGGDGRTGVVGLGLGEVGVVERLGDVALELPSPSDAKSCCRLGGEVSKEVLSSGAVLTRVVTILGDLIPLLCSWRSSIWYCSILRSPSSKENSGVA